MSVLDKFGGLFGAKQQNEQNQARQQTMSEMGFGPKAATPRPGQSNQFPRITDIKNPIAPKGVDLDRKNPQEAFADKILSGKSWSLESGSASCSRVRENSRSELTANHQLQASRGSEMSPMQQRMTALRSQGASGTLDPAIKARAETQSKSFEAAKAVASEKSKTNGMGM